MIARAGGSSGGPVRKPSVIKKKKKKDPMEDDASIDSDDPVLYSPQQHSQPSHKFLFNLITGLCLFAGIGWSQP